jgi:hypothetical protein
MRLSVVPEFELTVYRDFNVWFAVVEAFGEIATPCFGVYLLFWQTIP